MVGSTFNTSPRNNVATGMRPNCAPPRLMARLTTLSEAKNASPYSSIQPCPSHCPCKNPAHPFPKMDLQSLPLPSLYLPPQPPHVLHTHAKIISALPSSVSLLCSYKNSKPCPSLPSFDILPLIHWKSLTRKIYDQVSVRQGHT